MLPASMLGSMFCFLAGKQHLIRMHGNDIGFYQLFEASGPGGSDLSRFLLTRQRRSERNVTSKTRRGPFKILLNRLQCFPTITPLFASPDRCRLSTRR